MVYAIILLAVLVGLLSFLVAFLRFYEPIGGLLISETDEGYNVGVGLYVGYTVEDALSRKFVVLKVDKDFVFPNSHENQTL